MIQKSAPFQIVHFMLDHCCQKALGLYLLMITLLTQKPNSDAAWPFNLR